MLPSRVGEEDSSKIPAGENVLVIKTPKGLYIRTKKGRIYAVHAGSESGTSADAGWRCERVAMSSFPQSSQSVYAPSVSGMSPGVQCNDRLLMSLTSAGDSYSPRCVAQPSSSHAPSIPDVSSKVADDVCHVNPESFLNIMSSCDENVAWNSAVAQEGSMLSDEVSCSRETPFSAIYQQPYQDSSWSACSSAMQQSCSCAADLPADLLCIDASHVTERTDVSLPALTVRDQHSDSNSLDSLTFDDCGRLADNLAPVFDTGYHSALFSTHSNMNMAATSSFTSAAAAVTAAAAANVDRDVLDIDDSDITGAVADWSELSALMSETNC